MGRNLKTMKGGMDSFKDQKDELKSSLDEIKSSYGDQLKNIAVSVEAQAKGACEKVQIFKNYKLKF